MPDGGRSPWRPAVRVVCWMALAYGALALLVYLFNQSSGTGGLVWLTTVGLIEASVVVLALTAARVARPAGTSALAFVLVIVTAVGSLLVWIGRPQPPPAGQAQAIAACGLWQDYIFSSDDSLDPLTEAIAHARAAAQASARWAPLDRDLADYAHSQRTRTAYTSGALGDDCAQLTIAEDAG